MWKRDLAGDFENASEKIMAPGCDEDGPVLVPDSATQGGPPTTQARPQESEVAQSGGSSGLAPSQARAPASLLDRVSPERDSSGQELDSGTGGLTWGDVARTA